MLIEAAALAEPDPGVSADVTVLAVGAAAIVMLLVTRVVCPARRLASAGARRSGRPAATGRRSRLTAWPTSVAAAVGMRLALDPGRGRTAVPVRSALAGTVLSLLAAPARLILRPSTSPAQASRSASAMRAVRLSRISVSRWRWA